MRLQNSFLGLFFCLGNLNSQTGGVAAFKFPPSRSNSIVYSSRRIYENYGSMMHRVLVRHRDRHEESIQRPQFFRPHRNSLLIFKSSNAETDNNVAVDRSESIQPKSAKPTKGKSFLRARTTGVGAAIPEQVLTNNDIAAMGLDTSDDWISSRTGIKQRHVLDSTTSLNMMASQAATQALNHAGVQAEEIDLVIVATSSPDDLFGDATSVAHAIGAKNAVAFDLTAACSGFLFALVTGSQFLHSGAYSKAIIVGADALTRWVDWEDRNICVLFGDGAGAVVLEGCDDNDERDCQNNLKSGILGFELHSDGAGQSKLCLPYSGQLRSIGRNGNQEITSGAYAPITMEGKEVYTFATRQVPRVLQEALAHAGLTAKDVDHLLLHQANIRIMETVAKRLDIPLSKVLSNLSDYGNTSAGSIPLALNQAVKDGRVKKGDIVACAGFGAGLSWGSAIIRWG